MRLLIVFILLLGCDARDVVRNEKNLLAEEGNSKNVESTIKQLILNVSGTMNENIEDVIGIITINDIYYDYGVPIKVFNQNTDILGKLCSMKNINTCAKMYLKTRLILCSQNKQGYFGLHSC
ncbi:MAG: hypothetical protein HC892_19590 [Saprospiraceae bacterium]|nr:hypothetical protein [Saprospiraceae bacterium]